MKVAGRKVTPTRILVGVIIGIAIAEVIAFGLL